MKIKNYSVLGIMSGTSLDGLDMALCNFKYLNKKWNFELISTHYIEYSKDWKEKLSNLFYTGQLTVPGPGVPPSLISGQIVAKYVSEKKPLL